MQELYQNSSFPSIIDYLERMDVTLHSGYYFMVTKETPNGVVLTCLDNPALTAFAFSSLRSGEKVLASIRRAKIYKGAPRLLAQIESVICSDAA